MNKKVVLPISIHTEFQTLEQKLIFEAVVLPEIREVLIKYAPILDCDKSNHEEEREV